MTDILQRMMQEQLDGLLDDSQTEELFEQLNEDQDAAEAYARLQDVDDLLRAAPAVRAPERLAATIMARLAESMQQQPSFQEMPEEMRQALMLSVSMVTVSMMPVMVAASWLVLNTMRNPVLLGQVMQRVIALQLVMIDAMLVMLEEIEKLVREDPELAPVAMSLLPMLMKGMMEYLEHGTYSDLGELAD